MSTLPSQCSARCQGTKRHTLPGEQKARTSVCKAKDQPQKYLGDRLHLRESGVFPRMQVQQCSKHRGFVRWSTQNVCWDGPKYYFSLAFLPWSFSGDTTFFSRSARIGSTSMPSSQTGISGWHKSFKGSLWRVVGTDSACSSTSEKFSRARQFVATTSSHQKEL